MGPKKDTSKDSSSSSGAAKKDESVHSVDDSSDVNIEDIIEKSIKLHMDLMRKEVSATIKKSFETAMNDFKKVLDERISAVEGRVVELEKKVSDNISSISSNTDAISKLDIDLLKTDLDSIRNLSHQSISIANDSEQYSRMRSVRIRGLRIEDGKNAAEAAVQLFQEKLNLPDISLSDIDVSHPLPKKKSMSGPDQSPPVLVKFRSRRSRDAVIPKRKLLKGTVISIEEDLTSLNIQLMNRLRNSDDVDKTWSWGGKVYAVLKTGKMVVAQPWITVEEMSKSTFPAFSKKH